jgi:hypothetical protein
VNAAKVRRYTSNDGCFMPLGLRPLASRAATIAAPAHIRKATNLCNCSNQRPWTSACAQNRFGGWLAISHRSLTRLSSDSPAEEAAPLPWADIVRSGVQAVVRNKGGPQCRDIPTGHLTWNLVDCFLELLPCRPKVASQLGDRRGPEEDDNGNQHNDE